MPQYHWSTCPGDIKRQVMQFVDGVDRALEGQFKAAYLHGSLAMAAFHPERSDVDLLIVAKDRLEPAMKRALAQLSVELSGQPSPLEFSVLAETELHPWHHPAPFEFHYSESWRVQYEERLRAGGLSTWDEDPATDTDLAAHVVVTNRRGIALAGPSPQDVLPAIPEADYVHSIISDLVWAHDRLDTAPTYFVLNACRVYAYLCQQHIYSKDEAALWAMDMLPRTHVQLVGCALQQHRGAPGDVSGVSTNSADLVHFVDFISSEIRRYTGPYQRASKLVALLGK